MTVISSAFFTLQRCSRTSRPRGVWVCWAPSGSSSPPAGSRPCRRWRTTTATWCSPTSPPTAPPSTRPATTTATAAGRWWRPRPGRGGPPARRSETPSSSTSPSSRASGLHSRTLVSISELWSLYSESCVYIRTLVSISGLWSLFRTLVSISRLWFLYPDSGLYISRLWSPKSDPVRMPCFYMHGTEWWTCYELIRMIRFTRCVQP